MAVYVDECYSGPKYYWKINRVPLNQREIEFLKGEFVEGKLADSLLCHAESSKQ